eukprot:CAMPEP_0178897500 /NCGR_PEP_ID=MMETSP0786-20121207/1787_1 /TAXON_ID=186022 /ORGANISM="Thalassionema frauenfeldii, Strain CCMP 1798" /LENGTH=151 /DNA_ID=CAMNT_0020568069 /DNA_START=42 /DNA_END=497 /DNA_ORIENTATION=+
MKNQTADPEQVAMEGPATQALHELNDNLTNLPPVESLKRPMRDETRQETKRRRTSLSMNELLSSVETVEQYLSFPLIQWEFDDTESDFESENNDSSRVNLGLCLYDDEDADKDICIRRPGSSCSLREQARNPKLARSKAIETSLSSLAFER